MLRSSSLQPWAAARPRPKPSLPISWYGFATVHNQLDVLNHWAAVLTCPQLSNTLEFSTEEYASEISVAKDAGIDAFAVNMGADDPTSDIDRLSLLFNAAEQEDFKIMFSFDYLGNGVWDRSTVLEFIEQVSRHLLIPRAASGPGVERINERGEKSS